MAEGGTRVADGTQLDRVQARLEADRERNLADLMQLVAQPSISAQDIGVRDCAAIEEDLLRAAGLETRLLETAKHPMVYGEYVVQPPDPLDLWTTPPFDPTIRDGRIYARGVADNKAQHFSHIAAIRA